MHSESLSDHDLMTTYLDKRLAQCVSDDERGDMKGVMEFEAKHRTCHDHLLNVHQAYHHEEQGRVR
jgi:hypothetical protein